MKRIISIALSFLVLFSTIGMAKTTHFCMGEEMESAFGLTATLLDCGMEAGKSHQEDHQQNTLSKSDCCKNQNQLLQLDEESSLKKQQIQLDYEFAISFVHIFVFGLTENQTEEPISPYKDSPPLSEDLIILNQSFLI